MSSSLGPIEMCCDAPPYPVVRACRHIHFQTPEDVRWLRMSAFRTWRDSRQHEAPSQFWKTLWKRDKSVAGTCTCGEPLPELRLAVFTFETGVQVSYLLGQCSRCRTIFWDER